MSVTLNQLARAMSRAASRSEAAHAEMSGAAVAWAEANCAEMLCTAGVKCLFSGRYWLDQAVETIEHVTKRRKEASR